MTTIPLSILLEDLCLDQVSPEILVHGLAFDSRQVRQGDLFFACSGTHQDGRKFINQAIERGARAVLAEQNPSLVQMVGSTPIFGVNELKNKIGSIAAKFYGYPGRSLQIVGVTGTNGKTSTTHFLAAALQALGKPCGLIGTLGNGVYGKIVPGSHTTPDAISIQKLLADFREDKINHVAMEVSSHGLDQGRVQGVPFLIGIFTNLTLDHLDYHGSMEAYGAAKSKLFDCVDMKYAVINIDDPFGMQLVDRIGKDKQIFAISCDPLVRPPAHVSLVLAKHIECHNLGMRIEMVTPWGNGALELGLIGAFNVSNMLAVVASLCLLGTPLVQALKILSTLQAVSGRMQPFGGGKDYPLIIVDYSHTPDSLEKALLALRQHGQGDLYCVFGCGGDRDRGKRPIMAKIAESIADFVIVTDDNPRTEDPAQIVGEIMSGFVDRNKVVIEHDRKKAIALAIHRAKPGDCVLIAGKGAETYHEVHGKKFPLSDIEQVLLNIKVDVIT